MINLKSDLDYLNRWAADHREDVGDGNANTIVEAAHDINALKEYAERLKHRTHELSAEIDRLGKQRHAAAAALVEIFQPAIEDMISAALEDSSAVNELEDRIRRLEEDEPDDEEVRAAVRSMISDGEIVVSIDHM